MAVAQGPGAPSRFQFQKADGRLSTTDEFTADPVVSRISFDKPAGQIPIKHSWSSTSPNDIGFDGAITFRFPNLTPTGTVQTRGGFTDFVLREKITVELRIQGQWTYRNPSTLPPGDFAFLSYNLLLSNAYGRASGQSCSVGIPDLVERSYAKSPVAVDITLKCEFDFLGVADSGGKLEGSAAGRLIFVYNPQVELLKKGYATIGFSLIYSYVPPENLVTLRDEKPERPAEGETIGRDPISFEATLDWRLVTQALGDLALRVFDQDGILVKSSEFRRVSRDDSPGSALLKIPIFEIPPEVNQLLLKGVLIDPVGNRILAESEPVLYPILDVEIAHMEVVQRVQTPDNIVATVAGVPTLVRAFLKTKSGGTGLPVRGVLRVEALRPEDSIRGPLEIRPVDEPVVPKGSFSREVATDSMNFFLPINWTWQPVRLTVELRDEQDRPLGITDHRTAFFRPFAPDGFRILLVPVCYQPPGLSRPLCPKQTVSGSFLRQLYPFAARSFSNRWSESGRRIVWRRSLTAARFQDELKARVRMEFLHERFIGFKPSMVVGVLPDIRKVTLDSGRVEEVNILGLADPSYAPWKWAGRAAWIQEHSDVGVAQATLAHEVTHNLGIRHAGNPDNPLDFCAAYGSEGWPYEDSTIQHPGWAIQQGSLAGVASFARAALIPSSANDIMSNCASVPGSTLWISPYTLNRVIFSSVPNGDSDSPSKGSPKAAATRDRRAEARDLIIVSGSIRDDGNATLNPVFYATSDIPPDESIPNGANCLVVTGDTEEQFCFNLVFESGESVGREPPEKLSQRYFAFRLPAPKNVRRVAVKVKGAEGDALAISAAAPAVRLVSPGPGEVWSPGRHTIEWAGTDADGDALRYTVLYSSDNGVSWTPMAVGIEETSIEVDTARMFGGSEVFVKVQVTDGVRVAEAEAGPLEVIQTPAAKVSDTTLRFRKVTLGASRILEVPVESTGTGPLWIREATSDDPAFSLFSPGLPVSGRAGGTVPLQIRFSPSEAKLYRASLTIRTSDPAAETIRIVLEGRGIARSEPDAEVSPSTIDFGAVQTGAMASAVAALQNYGPGTLNIESLVSSDPQFRIVSNPPPALPPGRFEVKLEFRPQGTGSVAGTLRIRTNDTARPVLEVTLRGTGLSPGGGAGPAPTVRSVGSGATFTGPVVSGSWVTIFGANLAGTTRIWGSGDFNGNLLPTNLDGVEVTFNGKKAAVYFISPGQLNVQAPAGLGDGPVEVVVLRNGTPSLTFSATARSRAPGLFVFDPEGRKYLAAVHVDGTLAGKPGLFGSALNLRPIRPGDTVLLFGTGFGLTDPAVPPGRIFNGAAPLQGQVKVFFGNVPGELTFAGLVGAGLYQFNAVVPQTVPSGDVLVRIEIAGFPTQTGVFLPAENPNPAPPALTTEIESILPAMPVPADSIAVVYLVRNPQSDSGRWIRKLYLSQEPLTRPGGTLINSRAFDLNGQAEQRIRSTINPLPAGTVPGTYFLTIGLEPGTSAAESARSAEILSPSFPFEVIAKRPPHDLSVSGLTLSVSRAAPGDAISVEYTAAVKDAAGEPYSGTFRRLLFLSTNNQLEDGDFLLNSRTITISEGTATVTSEGNIIPLDFPPGSYSLFIRVDSDGGDFPLSNNRAGPLLLEIGGARSLFDIGAGVLTIEPSAAQAGGTVAISAPVTNASASYGEYRYILRIAQGRDPQIGDTVLAEGILRLEGAGTTLSLPSIRLPNTLAAGAYRVRLFLESAGDLSPANNTSAAAGLTIRN